MRVVAIVVARTGGEYVARTLSAIQASTRHVDSVVIVENGPPGLASAQPLGTASAQVVSTGHQVDFTEAIGVGTHVVATASSTSNVFWFLREGSEPRPEAISELVRSLEDSPSTAIVGPKLLGDEGLTATAQPTITEFGFSMSPHGQVVSLVDHEIDQGQFDTMRDVLAVGLNGMLIHESTWRLLGGLDDFFGETDAAVDLCVRARLAGQLVQVVPRAAVVEASRSEPGSDITSPSMRGRREWAQRRRSQLYRRIVYSRGLTPFFVWLTLVPFALVRMMWQLVVKRPGLVGAEFLAAFTVAVSLGSISRARSRLRRQGTRPWSVLTGVLVTRADMRQRRGLARDAEKTYLRRLKNPTRFLASGGLWTMLALAGVSIGMLFPLVGATELTGGALLPLAHSFEAMWNNVLFGWREGSPALIGPSDGFSLVIAVLGSLTWWQPSLVLVFLWFAAIPLSGLGAWMLVSQMSRHPAVRTFAAVVYALTPALLVSLTHGRPAAVIAHVALPWLFYAGVRAKRSWSASASAGLLLAVVAACAPSLIPALLIVWVGSLALSGRSFSRYIAIPLPTLTLFAPLLVALFLAKNPIGVFADPGRIELFESPPAWQTLLGFPTSGLGGWSALTDSAPGGFITISVVVVVLVGLVFALAVLGLFSPATVVPHLILLVMLAGFTTAIAFGAVRITFDESVPLGMWPGAALSLAWLCLMILASYGVQLVRRGRVLPAVAGMIVTAMLSAPLLCALYLGHGDVSAQENRDLPAYVNAVASNDSSIGTIALAAQPDGGISATLFRGMGPTLSASSTLISTNTLLTPPLEAFSSLVGNLVSASADQTKDQLSELGIGFVLLNPLTAFSGEVSPQQQEAYARAVTALQATGAVELVGQSDVGLLWRVPSFDATRLSALDQTTSVEPMRTLLLTATVLVFGLTALLALPTGKLASPPSRRRPIGDDAEEDNLTTQEDLRDELVLSDVLGGTDES